MPVEVFVTADAYFLTNGRSALFCCKTTSHMRCVAGSCGRTRISYVSATIQASNCLSLAETLRELSDPKCLGVALAFIGKLPNLDTGGLPSLLFVTKSTAVGREPLTQRIVQRIDRVAALPLAKSTENGAKVDSVQFDVCSQHCADQIASDSIQKATTDAMGRVAVAVATVERAPKKATFSSSSKDGAVRGKQRLLDDVFALLNDGGFYFTSEFDLTHRNTLLLRDEALQGGRDVRFFWNRFLLSDLLEDDGDLLNDSVADAIVQGYFGQRTWREDDVELGVTVCSRRCVARAGTRYNKRGLDEHGDCANYVETEQIVSFLGHNLSFVQVRGSVPLFWRQRGYKYRPPPTLDRSLAESTAAFDLHLDDQFARYGGVLTLVNLVEHVGREQPLSDSFVKAALARSQAGLTYVAFDFHRHCGAMRADRVQLLVTAVAGELDAIGYSWNDSRGALIRSQKGVLRTNCVDCLDRTNVVQAAFGRAVCERQLVKLGVVHPGSDSDCPALPDHLRSTLAQLWRANGDQLSMQYTGTAALKGDVSSSKQAKLGGVFRDGYNSASRYYVGHVYDGRRQAAIDALLGKRAADVPPPPAEDNEAQTREDLRQLVLECQRLILPDDEALVGGWALIDADVGGDASREDMDRIVLLTRAAIYVADYDDAADKWSYSRRVPLGDVVSLETGAMSLGRRRLSATCLRVTHVENALTGRRGRHVWRAASTRLFNNMAIALKSREEADEYVRAIGEQFHVALELAGFDAPLVDAASLAPNRGAVAAARRLLGGVSRSAAKLKVPSRTGATSSPSCSTLPAGGALVKWRGGATVVFAGSGLLFLCECVSCPSAVTAADISRLKRGNQFLTRDDMFVDSHPYNNQPAIVHPIAAIASAANLRLIDHSVLKTSASDSALGVSSASADVQPQAVKKNRDLFGMTVTSLAKLSSHVQQFGGRAQRSLQRPAPLEGSLPNNLPHDPFAHVREQISTSATKLILL